jgi:hypothetical protein
MRYSMPSAIELIPGASMDDFKTLDELNLITQVENIVEETTLECERKNNCRVRMNWAHTPIIYGARPAVMYYGQLANILVNPRHAPNSKRDSDLPVHVKFDGFRLDH